MPDHPSPRAAARVDSFLLGAASLYLVFVVYGSLVPLRPSPIPFDEALRRFQTELGEFIGQPLGPDALAERRRRNARQLQLPVRELRLLGAEPGESGANFRQRTEMCDLLLHSRKQLRNFGSRARHEAVVGLQSSVFSHQSLALGRWSLAIVFR